MKFSIITPSFRNSNWLKLCIASVADQQGVELEHIVQDSCSDDGTQDWLPQDPRVLAFIEKDAGMALETPDRNAYKVYIAPLIFCLAPLINTLLSLVWHPKPGR